jgi:hypothetical protein
MSNRLYDAVARIARHEVEARTYVSLGVVTAVHSAAAGAGDHAADVRLRDLDVTLPRVPVATGLLGFAATLAVGDLVLVTCVAGDVNAPVILGRLHHADLAPPQIGEGQLALRLPPGASTPTLAVLLDQVVPEARIRVGTRTDVSITDGVVTITAGDASITLDAEGSAETRIEVGPAKLTIGTGGDITIETTGSLTMKATQIELKADATMTLSAAKVDIN